RRGEVSGLAGWRGTVDANDNRRATAPPGTNRIGSQARNSENRPALKCVVALGLASFSGSAFAALDMQHIMEAFMRISLQSLAVAAIAVVATVVGWNRTHAVSRPNEELIVH